MPTDHIDVRLGNAMVDGRQRLILGVGDRIGVLADLLRDAPHSLIDMINDWPAWRDRVVEASARVGDTEARVQRWLPPLLPPKLLCIGANYAEHNSEMLGEIASAFPFTFLKPPSTTVMASGEPVPLPRFGEKLDYEGELAVVMGPDQQIFGYTIFNDLSIRDWVPGDTMLGIDWLVSKGFDCSAPLGPWVLPAEFAANPQHLQLKLWVNGELRQNGNTADMVFSIDQCVDHLRTVLTLEPGDVIGTGTPAGVAMKDGRYLKAGDKIRIEIENIGIQETTITQLPAHRGAPMTTDWLRSYYDDVDHMRLDEFVARHTDDVQVQFGNNPPAKGRDEVRAAIGHFWEMIGGLKHNFITVVHDGDTTVLDAAIDYQRKDGDVVTVPCATLLHRQGDLVDHVKIYLDLAPVFAPAKV